MDVTRLPVRWRIANTYGAIAHFLYANRLHSQEQLQLMGYRYSTSRAARWMIPRGNG
ncbi:hypothetical protein KCP71_01750 [Salmonella enterica subsp. enterica]|nr:hypothetical protein KCP71_01750 [Salmonella enterica subsp. enterica]